MSTHFGHVVWGAKSFNKKFSKEAQKYLTRSQKPSKPAPGRTSVIVRERSEPKFRQERYDATKHPSGRRSQTLMATLQAQDRWVVCCGRAFAPRMTPNTDLRCLQFSGTNIAQRADHCPIKQKRTRQRALMYIQTHRNIFCREFLMQYTRRERSLLRVSQNS